MSNEKMPFTISKVKEKKLEYYVIDTQLNHLMGKILTIIDSAIIDKNQNKAIKDLVRDKFNKKRDWIYQLCGLPNKCQPEMPETLEQPME
jgi:hypothetical protein